MVIGYKPHMEAPILAGTKIHTIRMDGFARWKPGVKMHMAVGVRTKQYRCFYQDVCRATQPIEIRYAKGGGISLFIEGQFFYYQTKWGAPWSEPAKKRMLVLAANDGFKTIPDFFAWFDRSFNGKIIHWTDLLYEGCKEEYQQASLFVEF